jgi:GNAT superfamily N-acetyltransferase
MWAPPDRDILQGGRVSDLIALVTELLGDEAIPRLTELARAAEYRPPEPHFYLGILGVAPGHQGKGLGGVLVEPVLEACDRGGFVAHLESSNPRNLGFYERLGFVATDEYRLGGAAGPLLTIMRRTPD